MQLIEFVAPKLGTSQHLSDVAGDGYILVCEVRQQ